MWIWFQVVKYTYFEDLPVSAPYRIRWHNVHCYGLALLPTLLQEIRDIGKMGIYLFFILFRLSQFSEIMQNEVLQFVSIPLYRKGLCSSDGRSHRNRKGRRECIRNDVWWTGERVTYFSHSTYPLSTIYLFFEFMAPSQRLRIVLVLLNILGSPIPHNGHIAQ